MSLNFYAEILVQYFPMSNDFEECAWLSKLPEFSFLSLYGLAGVTAYSYHPPLIPAQAVGLVTFLPAIVNKYFYLQGEIFREIMAEENQQSDRSSADNEDKKDNIKIGLSLHQAFDLVKVNLIINFATFGIRLLQVS